MSECSIINVSYIHGVKFFHTLKVALNRNKGYYLQMPVFGVFANNNDVIINSGYFC